MEEVNIETSKRVGIERNIDIGETKKYQNKYFSECHSRKVCSLTFVMTGIFT